MSSALVTQAMGRHIELFEVARPSFEQFALRHGRDLVVADTDVSGDRHPNWGKVAVLREVLDAYDSAVWIDADAVVVDARADIAAGVPAWRAMALAAHRYGGLEVPNFGVVYLRSCRWSKRFLERLWQAERFIDHLWLENAAVLDLLGYDADQPQRGTRRWTADRARVHLLDRSWNSIPADPSPAPRIRHFPGMAHDERLRHMRAAAAVAV